MKKHRNRVKKFSIPACSAQKQLIQNPPRQNLDYSNNFSIDNFISNLVHFVAVILISILCVFPKNITKISKQILNPFVLGFSDVNQKSGKTKHRIYVDDCLRKFFCFYSLSFLENFVAEILTFAPMDTRHLESQAILRILKNPDWASKKIFFQNFWKVHVLMICQRNFDCLSLSDTQTPWIQN